MCGIVGYIGDNEAYPVIINGLNSLLFLNLAGPPVIITPAFRIKGPLDRFSIPGGAVDGRKDLYCDTSLLSGNHWCATFEHRLKKILNVPFMVILHLVWEFVEKV